VGALPHQHKEIRKKNKNEKSHLADSGRTKFHIYPSSKSKLFQTCWAVSKLHSRKIQISLERQWTCVLVTSEHFIQTCFQFAFL
jgi:hypothetical protein